MATEIMKAYATFFAVDNVTPYTARMANKTRQQFEQSARAVGIAFTAMGAAITGTLGIAVKKSMDFQTAITEAAAVTGKTGDEFEKAKEKMSALAKELGITTVFSAAEAANAFVGLSRKGIDVASMSIQQLLPFLDFASGQQSDLDTATQLITGTMKGFSLSLDDTAHIADVFTQAMNSSDLNVEKLSTSMPIVSKTAQVLGISLEETAAMLGILMDNAIEASTAGTGLRNVMVEMGNTSGEVAKKLTDMGIDVSKADVETQGLAGALKVLTDQGMTAKDAMIVFGKKSGTVASTLVDAIEQTQTFTEKLKNADGASRTMAETMEKTFAGSLKLLQSALDGIILPIGEALIPALTNLAQVLAPILQSAGKWIELHPNITAGVVFVAGALGILMLILGPILIALPMLMIYAKLLGVGGLLAGVGTGATAAGAGATTAAAGFTAWTASLGLWLIAIAAAAALMYKAYQGVKLLNDAVEQQRESEERLQKSIDNSVAKLKEKGVVLDEEAMKTMTREERIAYINEQMDAQKRKLHDDEMRRIGETDATEEDYHRATLARLGLEVDARLATLVASSDLTTAQLKGLILLSDAEKEAAAEKLRVIDTTVWNLQERAQLAGEVFEGLNLRAVESIGTMAEQSSGILTWMRDLWTNIWNEIYDTVWWRVKWIKDMFASVSGMLGFGGGNEGGNDVPKMATGGIVTGGGMVRVHKDEDLLLPKGAEVIPARHTASVRAAMEGESGRGKNQQITFNAPFIKIERLDAADENQGRQFIEFAGEEILKAMSARGIMGAAT